MIFNKALKIDFNRTVSGLLAKTSLSGAVVMPKSYSLNNPLACAGKLLTAYTSLCYFSATLLGGIDHQEVSLLSLDESNEISDRFFADFSSMSTHSLEAALIKWLAININLTQASKAVNL